MKPPNAAQPWPEGTASPKSSDKLELMDLEKAMQFLLDQQARTEAVVQRLGEGQQRMEAAQVQLAENLIQITDIVREVAEAQRRHEEEFRRAEEERRRLEEERRRAEARNREEHKSFEESRQETNERFNALIKTMDEWIRERRKGNGAA